MNRIGTMRVHNTKGDPIEVDVFAEFCETVDGGHFHFAVTREVNGSGLCLTEKRTGRKVIEVRLTPSWSVKQSGRDALETVIYRHGADRVREVMEREASL